MAGGGGENMLLVVNPNDSASLQIANAYAALRNIPANNIVFIAPPTNSNINGQPISQADVTSYYLNPIKNYISARGLTNQINYIGTIGQAVSYGIVPEPGLGLTGANSLNYALSLLTPLTNGSGLTMQNATSYYNDPYLYMPVSGLYQDPTNIPVGSNTAIQHSNAYSIFYPVPNQTITTQYYMSGAIGYTGTNGNTVSEVIAGLQSAAASDGSRPVGTIYFENSGDSLRSGPRMPEWYYTQQQLSARNIPWFAENGNTPQNRNDVLGAVIGADTMTLPNNSTYLPGSWADNLTSYGCDFSDLDQTKATKLIAAGASGTTGSVFEPYNITYRFTNSSIYTFIADGSTFGEALAKSVAVPDIQMPLGDMLTQPFADIPKVAFISGPGNYGSAIGAISISASAGLTNPRIPTTGISKLELLVDGLVRSSVSGGTGTFNLNTANLSDGVHEVRIVGINDSQAASEGYAAQQIVVNNHGRAINFNGGNLTLTLSAGTISLAATAGDGTVSQFELTCLGRTVARGSLGSLSLSPTALAYGDNVLVPVAVFSDGSRVSGGAVTVHRETGTPNNWGNGGNAGLWSNPSNWTSGLPQNGDGVARFSGSGGTVTIDNSASVEEIEFEFDKSGAGYTIAASPGQTLTLSSTNGSGSQSLINVISGSHTISAPLVLATAGNLMTVTNPTDFLTVSGIVSGSGSLTKTGSGWLSLTGSNTYTGTTTVNAGTLQLSTSGALAINGNLSVSGGTVQLLLSNQIASIKNVKISAGLLDIGAFSNTVSEVQLTGGTITGTTGALTSTTTFDVQSGAISANLNGNVSLNKTTANTVVLSGSNSYTGGTFVAAGGLKLDFSRAGAPIANIINNVTNTSSLALGGGILAIQGNANTTNSQWFNGLAINPGNSAIVLAASTSNPLLLSLGSISRSPGGTVNFTLPSGTLSGSNGIITTTTNTNGILGGYATVGGTDWASSNGTGNSITAYSTYTGSNLGALGSSGTLNVSPTGAQNDVTSALSFNTLNLSGTVGVTMTGSGSLTLAGGGLIGNTSGSISGGILAGSAGGELIVITPANLTIGSVIADNGGPTGLTKAGSGTLILIGSNTYSGVTTIGAGTLQVGSGGESGTLGTETVTNNSALVFNLSGTTTFNGVISGVGSLTQAGTGILAITGSNTYTGGTTVSAGTLQIGSGNTSGSLVGNITNNAVLMFNRSDNPTFDGVISGSGSLTKLGTGTLYLTGSNSYAGGTTLASGELSISGNNNLGAASSRVIFNGGILQITGATVTDMGSHSVDWSSFNGAFDIANAINVFTVSSDISGSGSLTKLGTGMLLLTGSNSYAGGTTLTDGELSISSSSNLGAASSQVTFNGGTLQITGTTVTNMGGHSVNWSSFNGAFDIANAINVFTVSGAIGGSGGLTKLGTGMLLLTGSNSYAGGTTLTDGELSISGSSNLGAAGSQVTFNGGTLQITGTAVTNMGGHSVNWSSFNGAFDIANAANVFTVSSAISGGGSLTKLGAGTLLLTGSNSYRGGTMLSAGELSISGSNNLGAANSQVIFNGGILQITGTAVTNMGNYSVDWSSFNGGFDIANAANVFTVSSAISGNGSLTKLGIGTLLLTGNNLYTGGTKISTGTLQIGSGGTSGSLTGNITDNAVLVFNRSDNPTFGGVISGSGSFTKAGTGILTLTGSNNYSGGTTLSTGTLKVGNGGTSGSLTGNITDNAVLVFNRSDNSVFGGTIGGVGSLTQAGAGILTLAGNNNYSGITTVSAGTLQIGNGGTSGSLTGNITDNAVLVFNRSDNSTFGGIIGGVGSLTKAGAGILTLTGSNNYSGITTLSAGTLQVGNGGTSGSLTGNITNNAVLVFNRSDNSVFGGTIGGGGSLTQAGTGILTLTGNNSYSGGTTLTGGELSISGSNNLGAANSQIIFNGGILQITGTAVTDLGSHSVNWSTFNGGFDIANAANVFTVNNDISGSGGLTKLGAGTLLLTGSNSYRGGTTVSAGMLQIGSGGTSGAPDPGPITNNSQLLVNCSDTYALANAISGSGSLTQSGSGTLQLTASNTYSGPTLISSGTLQIGNGGSNGAPGTGLITNNSQLVINLSDNYTLTNAISGSGSVSQSGPGTITLTASNSYSGRTTINLGTLAVSSTANLGTGALTFGGSGAGVLNIFGSTAFTSSTTITLSQNGTIQQDNSAIATLSGIIDGSGNLTKSGSGGLVLTGTNTYTGGTTVSSGTLRILSPTALPYGALTINAGGVLIFDPSELFSAPSFADSVDILVPSVSSISSAPAISPFLTASPLLVLPSTLQPSLNSVPEPDTLLLLLAAGGVGLLWHIWRSRKKKTPTLFRPWEFL